MKFDDWYERSCGNWVSYRRYFYGPSRNPDNLEVNFSITQVGEEYSLRWWSDRNEGVMDFKLVGETVVRSRSYYDSEETKTKMERLEYSSPT